MAERERRRALAVKGGVVAGLIAGLGLSFWFMLASVVRGQSLWIAMKVPALPFLGERVFQSGFEAGPVVLGLLTHFAVSIAWGVLFGLLFFGLPKSATVPIGAFYGIVVWLGMYYLVLPIAGLAELRRAVPVGAAILQHVLFGLLVGIGFLPYQRPIQPPLERPIGP